MSDQSVLTPKVGVVVRRSLFWLAVALFAIVIALITMAAIGGANSGARLDPTSPAPNGAKALVEVLRSQGVTVVVTSTLEETEKAIDDASSSTLVIHDDGLYLTDAKLEQAVDLAEHVVLVDATFPELQAVAPEVAQAGFVDELLDADCSVPTVERAQTVSGDGSGYRVTDDAPGIIACLGSGDDVFSLIEIATRFEPTHDSRRDGRAHQRAHHSTTETPPSRSGCSARPKPSCGTCRASATSRTRGQRRLAN